MRNKHRTVEVAWTRTRSSDADAPRETLRIRQGRDDWRELQSVDDLPPEVRKLVGEFFDKDASLEDMPFEQRPETADAPQAASRRSRRHILQAETGETFRLEYFWFEGCAVIAYLFAVAACVYFAVTTADTFSDGLIGWLLSGAVWVPTVVGGYVTLATLLNRTVFTIADGTLTVRHGPLPWPGNREIDVEDVRQLYCSVYSAGKGRIRWRVQAHTDFAGSVTLLDHVRTKAEAVSIERAIERHLGIPDWPRFGD